MQTIQHKRHSTGCSCRLDRGGAGDYDEAGARRCGNERKEYTMSKTGKTFLCAALTYTETLGEFPNEAEHICTLDGESISYAGLQAALDDFTAGMTEASYSFWASAGVGESPAGTVAATRQALRTLTNPTAQVSTHRVTVDGKTAAPAAYEINGNNYCKLRDIAQLLRGTAAQFEVTWNGAAQRIDLTDGAGYTSVGGELAALPTGGKAAELTGASVYLDGRQLDLTAYNIADNNYFKLRDLGAALDFGVTWDNGTRTVAIDTDAPYAAE